MARSTPTCRMRSANGLSRWPWKRVSRMWRTSYAGMELGNRSRAATVREWGRPCESTSPRSLTVAALMSSRAPLQDFFGPVFQDFLKLGHELVSESAIDQTMVEAQ